MGPSCKGFAQTAELPQSERLPIDQPIQIGAAEVAFTGFGLAARQPVAVTLADAP